MAAGLGAEGKIPFLSREATDMHLQKNPLLRFAGGDHHAARTGQFAEIPAFNASELDDAALSAEFERIRARGSELSALDTLTPEQTTELTELGPRLDAVQGEQTARATAAAELAATRERFSSLPAPVADPAPAAPVADPAPAPAAPAPVVPSVAELAVQTPPVAPERTEPQVREFSVTLTADGAGALGRAQGPEPVTVLDVARAVTAAFGQYGSGGGGVSSRRAIAQFTRTRDERLRLTGSQRDDYTALEYARNQTRLPGGNLLQSWQSQVTDAPESLTAAAGWCAPSENLYDVCSLWSMDGMLDIPSLTATRGGFNYASNQPTYQALEANLSFTVLTEAQVIAGTEKACAEIPCPTFEDRRLDVAVSCITASFLQTAGYPEWVNNWVDGLLTNHAHKLNENVISQIVTEAGAAVVVPPQGAAAPGNSPDTSATASILAAIELAATDMRYQQRMPFSQTFEVVLPAWSLAQIRADISRRNGWGDQAFNVTNQMIVSWFAVRNIRPQFVYDWQDAYSVTPPTGFPGGAAALTALPTAVNFLIYPAGAAVLVRQDVVTLSNVYDSANLAQNLFTRLFAEEGFAPIFPCGGIRQYTANLCPSGATAYQAYTGCAAPVALP